MDADLSGEVSIAEFVEGFMSLKGVAKSVDIWLLKGLVLNVTRQVEALYARTRISSPKYRPSDCSNYSCRTVRTLTGDRDGHFEIS